MTVEELIDELMKIEDKSKLVNLEIGNEVVTRFGITETRSIVSLEEI